VGPAAFPAHNHRGRRRRDDVRLGRDPGRPGASSASGAGFAAEVVPILSLSAAEY